MFEIFFLFFFFVESSGPAPSTRYRYETMLDLLLLCFHYNSAPLDASRASRLTIAVIVIV